MSHDVRVLTSLLSRVSSWGRGQKGDESDLDVGVVWYCGPGPILAAGTQDVVYSFKAAEEVCATLRVGGGVLAGAQARTFTQKLAVPTLPGTS